MHHVAHGHFNLGRPVLQRVDYYLNRHRAGSGILRPNRSVHSHLRLLGDLGGTVAVEASIACCIVLQRQLLCTQKALVRLPRATGCVVGVRTRGLRRLVVGKATRQIRLVSSHRLVLLHPLGPTHRRRLLRQLSLHRQVLQEVSRNRLCRMLQAWVGTQQRVERRMHRGLRLDAPAVRRLVKLEKAVANRLVRLLKGQRKAVGLRRRAHHKRARRAVSEQQFSPVPRHVAKPPRLIVQVSRAAERHPRHPVGLARRLGHEGRVGR
mmetsp:Transcript_8616/g.27462  ORF Transcript_8616/g.27462 Transcript_8616/m.27462 type:complete len:265 (-) Transcript_8616:1598-2392(-)